MRVTVVLCTRNRKVLLLAALERVARETADVPWESVVVDNGSRDGTGVAVREIAASFPAPLRLASEPRRGLAHARNRALAVARGAILLFLDDDALCRAGWLRAHVRAFENPEVVGTGGRIVPLLPPDAPGWFHLRWGEGVGGPASSYDLGDRALDVGGGSPHPVPFGANMGLRADVVRHLGGFRTDLGWGRRMIPGEETELFARMLARGGRCVYVPDAVVDHRIDSARCRPGYVLRWYRGYGRYLERFAPPRPPRHRIREVRRQAVRAIRQRVSAARRSADGTAEYADALRRAGTAQGRLLELLGL